jgi:hypothetical protein
MELNLQTLIAILSAVISLSWFIFNNLFKQPINNLTAEVKNLHVILLKMSERITEVEVKLQYLECKRENCVHHDKAHKHS